MAVLFLSISLALANAGGDAKEKINTTQSCSANASDCNFDGNWQLFKQNISDTVNSGSKVVKGTADEAGEYAQKGWEKTKSATTDGWQSTKDTANSAWEKTKDLAADGWESAKEIAQKGVQKVDGHLNVGNQQTKNKAVSTDQNNITDPQKNNP